MRIEPFALERWQSVFEHRVEVNLAESGVQPLSPGELLDDPRDLASFLAVELVYSQTNGTAELREAIAALHPGATADHILVTNGGSEANFIALWRLVEPGDEVIVMVPNYMQAAGLVAGFSAVVRPWPLRRVGQGGSARWRPDFDELASLVTSRTRAIAICNPNNPTGARLDEADVDRICAIAARSGLWLLSDEIYRGAELDGHATASVWSRYDRAIVTGGLSKAYGLPGLRIGWALGSPALVAELWGYHDYTTIGPGALNDYLARLALAPARRARLLERTRTILRRNHATIARWLDGRADVEAVPPEAGAISFANYRQSIGSTALVTRLLDQQSLLVVPGDHFGMDGYVRIGFGGEPSALEEGLRRLSAVLDEIDAEAPP